MVDITEPIHFNKNNFASEVENYSGLVLVDFWAEWCGPCRMIAPIISELANEWSGKVKVGKLNVDEEPEIAGKFQIFSIPTILLFRQGEIVNQIVGAQPKANFNKILTEAYSNMPADGFELNPSGKVEDEKQAPIAS